MKLLGLKEKSTVQKYSFHKLVPNTSTGQLVSAYLGAMEHHFEAIKAIERDLVSIL